VSVEIRGAVPDDEEPLAGLDRAQWSTLTSPAPPPSPGQAFFGEGTAPEDVLVALVDDEVVGYVRLARATRLPASDHVLQVRGLVVSSPLRRRGVGRALLAAAAAAARARGARRLTLRVLGHNDAARRLYESAGFVVEGILRGEFLLDGVWVDDVCMALDLTAEAESHPRAAHPVS
jgi:ribosomal protein S18 acetylase RimI-like enzyme